MIKIERGTSRHDLLELIADLSGPWYEPMAFAEFGTDLQRTVLAEGSVVDAYAAVDAALLDWARTINTQTVLEQLAAIVQYPPGADFYSDLASRRQAQWDDAISWIIQAIQDANPDEFQELRGSLEFVLLKDYIENDDCE